MKKIYPVNLNGNICSPEIQTKTNLWQTLLKEAYQFKRTVCLCPGTGDKKLKIRHMSKSDTFHLSAYSNTGFEHADDCSFYGLGRKQSGLGGYERNVIEIDGNAIKVRLSITLKAKSAPLSTTITDIDKKTPGNSKSKPAMSILGLLHLLWTESALNTWKPSFENRRSTGTIYNSIMLVSGKIKVGKLTLADNLLVAANSGKINDEKVKRIVSAGERLILVAPLKSYTDERDNSPRYLPLDNDNGFPKINISLPLWNKAKQSFQSEFSSWRNGNKVMAIVQIDVPTLHKSTNKFFAPALELGLMAVSDSWIPIDSSYEGLVERKLVREGRSFIKPLRYDANNDIVFPDFILLDLDPAYPLEVFGMSTPEYLERKAIKIDYYEKNHDKKWWFWDVPSKPSYDSIPELPEKE